jgi:hypothetical protein
MWYKTFLPLIHEITQPERYIEIGIRHGYSLSLSPNAKKIAIDPAYSEVDMKFDVANTHFFKTTSDYYFQHNKIADIFEKPFSLGYIDGLHKFEYALRDYINLEKSSGDDSIIIIDDVLPRTREEASREPSGGSWAGDVWKLILCFVEYRPDLAARMIVAKSEPTGCLIITNPDKCNQALIKHYDEILSKYLHIDFPDFPDERVMKLAVPAEDALKKLKVILNEK